MMVNPKLPNGYNAWLDDMASWAKSNRKPISAFSISLYGTLQARPLGDIQMANDPRELAAFVESVRADVAPYYPKAHINISEIQLFRDENGRQTGFCTEATNLGAAWYAAILKNAYDAGVNRVVGWGTFEYGSCFTWNGLKSPVYNVVEMYSRMRDFERLAVTVSGTESTSCYIDCIAGEGGAGGRISAIVFSYDPTRSDKEHLLAIQVNGLQPLKRYALEIHCIDRTRSNYRDELLEDFRAAGFADFRDALKESASQFSEHMLEIIDPYFLKPEAYAVFEKNERKYQMMDDLEIIDQALVRAGQKGMWDTNIKIRTNSIFMLNLAPSGNPAGQSRP
jgi:xylan 1,4-beta-xylosidase